MSSPPLPRARSMSSPAKPSFGSGPKWLNSQWPLPTPPDSDTNEENEAAPLKRPARHFAAFDLGFIPLIGTAETENTKREQCYEELDEEPEQLPTPCIKLKDGRELRPLLKHRKRSASHHIPNSARWDSAIPTSASSSSLNTLEDKKPSSENEPEHEHARAHVHFSEALENVCLFDESAPAHDSDPTHTPLEPPRQRTPPPPPSPRVRLRPLRLPGTVIASPMHKAAYGFTGGSPEEVPHSPSPFGHGHEMHLQLAYDSHLPSPANAPNHGMIVTQYVRLSPNGDSLTGIARVRNVAFDKHVCIVYTADDWATRREVGSRWTDSAQDLPPRPDGWDDFEFHLPLAEVGIQASAGTAVRAKILMFAVRYRVPGQGEWWDNRDGANWVARFRAVGDF
ncbi:hypothetical protein FRC10_005127 [Ceratobasidium sp. 414]|nr:hypothetical protein FRC10_005127 [Ceratobasidium sp. 414]